MESQFSLRWNNYVNHITDAFGSLLHEEDLVDVTLSCEGKKIKAHKMLLSACSPYFCSVFKENPCQHPVIVFRNVQFADLNAIVQFIYNGEVNVLQDQLESFLSTAEMLEVKGLTDKENEREVVETSRVTETVIESMQTGGTTVREQPTKTVSRKQVSSAPSTECSSPPAKKIKSSVEKPSDQSSLLNELGLSAVVKEEIIDDVEDTVVTENKVSISLIPEVSRTGPESSQIGSFDESSRPSHDNDDVEEPSTAEENIINLADDPTDDGSSTNQDTPSYYVQLADPKITSVPFKKRKNMKEGEIHLEGENSAKSEKNSIKAICPHLPASKEAQLIEKTALKGKIHIPKSLTITTKQVASDLFDYPIDEPQDEASVALRSEDATTPVHEELIPYSQETPVSDNVPSAQISEGEPEVAEEAPILGEGQIEPEEPTDEETKEPEFDYFGCEICKHEAKPVDLERLIFNHKCPICPCACFCAHLLKEHMKLIHGWFNVQRRFTHY